jgi:2-phospho-L-lactate guanylyltransferase
MSVWAVIPVKPLNRAKSRLAQVLSPEQRFEFARMMLLQVLSVTLQSPRITGVVVISRDTRAIGIAREMGAKTIQESSYSDLNPALERATTVLSAWRAGTILIIPADLPFINHEDIDGIVDASEEGPCVVLSTDRHADGTNVMLVRPPGLIEYAYGVGSFRRHIEAADNLGVMVTTYESERVMLDIDEPHDLEEYNRLVASGAYEHLKVFLPDMMT